MNEPQTRKGSESAYPLFGWCTAGMYCRRCRHKKQAPLHPAKGLDVI